MSIQFPLRYFLLAIIVFLVVIVGGIIGWSSQSTIKTLLEESAHSTIENVEKEIAIALQNEEHKAATLLSILSNNKKLYAIGSEKEIKEQLPMVAETLEQLPNLVTIYTGNSDGNLLAIMKLKTEIDYKAYSDHDGAPRESTYAVRTIKNHLSKFMYFTANLEQVDSIPTPKNSAYDPRVRPWYKDALAAQNIIKTPVYTFYTTKKKGYTLAKQVKYTDVDGAKKTTVFAVDVRLDYLDNQIAMLRPSPNSQISLVDNKGNLISGDPLDKHIYDEYSFTSEQKIKEYEDYFFTINKISTLSNDLSYHLVLKISKEDLFSQSSSLYKTQIILTLFCILIGTVFGLIFSEKMTQHIKTLSEKMSAIRAFTFHTINFSSHISDLQKLSDDIDDVSSTVNAFKTLTYDITRSQNAEQMVTLTLQHILYFTSIPTAILFINVNNKFIASSGVSNQKELTDDAYKLLTSISTHVISEKSLNLGISYSKFIEEQQLTAEELSALKTYGNEAFVVPLLDRQNQSHGALVFLDKNKFSYHTKKFIKDLSPYLSLSLENKKNINKQKELFESFIHIIAGAIDTKNPVTAKHCIKVPSYAIHLARAACERKEGKYASFDLTESEWEMVYISAWLHDCGKITTPEYVIDKATKLETVHNRIHEIRMRFELLKREKELEFWKNTATNKKTNYADLEAQLNAIDEDFYFIARCNLSNKVLQDKDIERIDAIASQTWTATLDDSIGLSINELKRRSTTSKKFPFKEKLLADKQEHKIERHYSTDYPKSLGIKLQATPYLYDNGELKNIKIAKGTLTEEERFKVNEHIIQTLIMLRSLPFPDNFKQIPEWAASHHERMDGKGYPRNLTKDDIHPVARMIAIADVYEALTADDRPYKTKKSHPEALKIMQEMSDDGHLDPDLLEIFANECDFSNTD